MIFLTSLFRPANESLKICIGFHFWYASHLSCYYFFYKSLIMAPKFWFGLVPENLPCSLCPLWVLHAYVCTYKAQCHAFWVRQLYKWFNKCNTSVNRKVDMTDYGMEFLWFARLTWGSKILKILDSTVCFMTWQNVSSSWSFKISRKNFDLDDNLDYHSEPLLSSIPTKNSGR